MDKNTIRQQIIKKLKHLSPQEKKQQSSIICKNIKQNPLWQKASVVALYIPMSTEPDIRALLAETQKTILLPKIQDNRITLSPYTQQTTLKKHTLGFLQPDSKDSTEPPQLILVPGLAFDKNGNRLGRGGGWYDKLLTQLPKSCKKAGICYSIQVLDSIPKEEHDIKMDIIITNNAGIDTSTKKISS